MGTTMADAPQLVHGSVQVRSAASIADAKIAISDLDFYYGTHKAPRVAAWFKRRPRYHLHFTPTSASWLNLVERWFREITDKRIRRGSFRNVEELTQAIMDYLAAHNSNPESFTWTAKAQDILEKVRRARAVLDKISSV